MPMRRIERKPGLNRAQRKARMRFCRRYGAWTEADWLRVLYSDESTFRVLPAEEAGHWVRYRRRGPMDRYKVNSVKLKQALLRREGHLCIKEKRVLIANGTEPVYP